MCQSPCGLDVPMSCRDLQRPAEKWLAPLQHVRDERVATNGSVGAIAPAPAPGLPGGLAHGAISCGRLSLDEDSYLFSAGLDRRVLGFGLL